jgi:hypothetical protein
VLSKCEINIFRNSDWTQFSSSLNFRGTLNDLEGQVMNINVIKHAKLWLKEKSHFINYPLRGVTFNGVVKMHTVPKVERLLERDGDVPDILIRGKININELPKFRQIGFESKVQDGAVNICVLLQKLNYSQLSYKQSVYIFSTVEFVNND